MWHNVHVTHTHTHTHSALGGVVHTHTQCFRVRVRVKGQATATIKPKCDPVPSLSGPCRLFTSDRKKALLPTKSHHCVPFSHHQTNFSSQNVPVKSFSDVPSQNLKFPRHIICLQATKCQFFVCVIKNRLIIRYALALVTFKETGWY